MNKKTTNLAIGQLWCIINMQLQKEVISIQKQPSCEKGVWPQKAKVKKM